MKLPRVAGCGSRVAGDPQALPRDRRTPARMQQEAAWPTQLLLTAHTFFKGCWRVPVEKLPLPIAAARHT
eukprot:3810693-Prymnesium_polylepis.1